MSSVGFLECAAQHPDSQEVTSTPADPPPEVRHPNVLPQSLPRSRTEDKNTRIYRLHGSYYPHDGNES